LTARKTSLGAARGTTAALDVLAVGAHPDDVELGCGGTLALLAAAGRAVGIVHLTSGEAGSRGDASVRRREAGAAARELRVPTLEILDCGDGGLRTGRDEEDALIEVLRRLRPRLVLGPPAADRHPDHGRAHSLLRDACFYAGLAKRSPELGAPHRPGALFCYLQHDLAVPTFVVDVTSVWERKIAALDAYASQLWPSDVDVGEQLACSQQRAEASSSRKRSRQRAETSSTPTRKRMTVTAGTTFVGSRDFRLSIEARARHLGVCIGATFGEGFLALRPLAVADPLDLLPRGPV
jgi:bacillithiol biosynthesis deacetylase BshB1